VNDVTPEILAAGLKRAHEVLTPVLTGVRAQVATVKNADNKFEKLSVGSHLIN
jgi:hypothetical protein